MNYHCIRKITYQSFQTIMNKLFGRIEIIEMKIIYQIQCGACR